MSPSTEPLVPSSSKDQIAWSTLRSSTFREAACKTERTALTAAPLNSSKSRGCHTRTLERFLTTEAWICACQYRGARPVALETVAKETTRLVDYHLGLCFKQAVRFLESLEGSILATLSMWHSFYRWRTLSCDLVLNWILILQLTCLEKQTRATQQIFNLRR